MRVLGAWCVAFGAWCVALGASISSPRIGTFFDVPDWIPAEVESARTYGSDDATNATRRIDATALAAVNACPEAYYERAYYANVGLSNVWDEAVYGPRCEGGHHLDTFRFMPPSGADRTKFVWQPDTNRVANMGTRRFVEYSNLADLCTALGGGDDVKVTTPDDFLLLRRPSWRRLDHAGNEIRPVWSSTLFDTLAMKPEEGQPETTFPKLDWMSGEQFIGGGIVTYNPQYWQNLTLSFRDLAASEPGSVDWSGGKHSTLLDHYACLSGELIAYLNFREDPSWSGPMTDYDNMALHGYMPSRTIGEGLDDLLGGDAVVITTRVSKAIWELTAANEVADGHRPGYGFQSIGGKVGKDLERMWRDRGLTNVVFDVSGMISQDGGTGGKLGKPGFIDDDESSGLIHFATPIYSFTYSDTNLNSVSCSCDPVIWYPLDIYPHPTNDNVTFSIEYNMTDQLPVELHMDRRASSATPTELRLPYGEIFATFFVQYDVVTTNSSDYAKLNGIISPSRRLISDPVAGLGVGLSALDRTYCHLPAPIPTVVSNSHARAKAIYEVSFHGRESGVLSWDYDEQLWMLPVSDKQDHDIPRQLSMTSAVEYVTNTVCNDYVLYADPFDLEPSCLLTSTADGRVGYIAQDAEELGELLTEWIQGARVYVQPSSAYVACIYGAGFGDDGRIMFLSMTLEDPVRGEIFIDMSDSPVFPVRQEWLGISNATITAGVDAGIGYMFGSTYHPPFEPTALDRRRFGFMPYPCDFSRVDMDNPPQLWIVQAKAVRSGTRYTVGGEEFVRPWTSWNGPDNPPKPIVSDGYPYSQTFEYRSDRKGYTNMSGFHDVTDTAYQSLVVKCDYDFENAAGIARAELRRPDEWLKSKMKQMEFKASGRFVGMAFPEPPPDDWMETAHAIIELAWDGSRARVKGGRVTTGYDESIPLSYPFEYCVFAKSFSGEVSYATNRTEFLGCQVRGRMSSLSKVNWNWNALRRSPDDTDASTSKTGE